MSDDTERSDAMRGSQEPVAWAVYLNGFYGVTVNGSYPTQAVAAGHEVVPLYRSPTLTDAERESLRIVLELLANHPMERNGLTHHGRTIRELLERLG